MWFVAAAPYGARSEKSDLLGSLRRHVHVERSTLNNLIESLDWFALDSAFSHQAG
jgi:hypothetical protein